MSQIPFKCPQCQKVHHNGPIDPATPDIFECPDCGRFRLRMDMPVVGVAPRQIPGTAAFAQEEIPGAIKKLMDNQDMDFWDLRLVESLKELQLLRAQDEAGVKLTQGVAAVAQKFLEDHALVGLPATATPGEAAVGEGQDPSGIGTSPSSPDGERLYTLDVGLSQLLQLLKPMLMDANLTGRFSGRKAVLLSFAKLLDDRAKHHTQAAIAAPSPTHHVHQGAVAAYEAAAQIARQFAEEGAQEKPTLDS